MLKKLLLVLGTLALSLNLNAAPYQEGKHYSVLPNAATSAPEVREYFSFYCGACKGFNTVLPEIMASLGKDVALKKTHVDFMGGVTPEIQFLLTKALIVAEEVEIDKKFSSALFNYLQVERAKISNEKDIRNIFILSGGDGVTFDKSIKSFGVISKAKRNKKIQDDLAKQRLLSSVPTFVVNGKYVINAKALDRNDYINDYKKIIAFLVSQ